MMISHHRLFRTIFRLLFNFQGSSLLSFRKPLYYITSFSICQEVFEIFFRIFSFSRHRRFIIHVLTLATFIFYHISPHLSRRSSEEQRNGCLSAFPSGEGGPERWMRRLLQMKYQFLRKTLRKPWTLWVRDLLIRQAFACHLLRWRRLAVATIPPINQNLKLSS